MSTAADVLEAIGAFEAAGGAPGVDFWLMIETPLCILNIKEVTGAHPRLKGIVMGTSDLSKDTRVREIMTSNVIAVSPQTGTRDCMALMREKRIRHLPVVEGGRVLGMLSIRDLLDDLIADHEMTIQQLESYIHS